MNTVLVIVSVLAVFLLLTCLFFFVVLAACFGITYKSVTSNFELQNLVSEYARFLEMVGQTVSEDTEFLRSELARKLKADSIPEYQELNRSLLAFENKIVAIRDASRQLSAASGLNEGSEERGS